MNRREFVVKGGLTSLTVASTVTLGGGVFAGGPKEKIIRIGIIGTGSRGTGLIPYINEIKNLDIVACCDLLSFRLKEAIGMVTGPVKGYLDYFELLDNKEVDAVIVATPFSTHAEIAIASLDAGKHVYCEKTMAKGFDGIMDLVAKAKTTEKIFQTGHQLRCSPLCQHVVKMISEGEIGVISAFQCQYNRNGDWRRAVPRPELEHLINWRMYKEYSGGLLAELSSHHIDFVNWVLESAPYQVMGVGGIDYWKDGRETYDNIHLIYSYPNGIEAKYTCLTTNAWEGAQIKILGSKGTIIMDHSHAWLHKENKGKEKKLGNIDGVSGATIHSEEGRGVPIKIDQEDPSKEALMAFAQSILREEMPITNVYSGAKTAICVQMGLDAMHTNSIVKWKSEFNKVLSQENVNR